MALSAAQDATDPLEGLRVAYQQDIARAVQPLREKYCGALSTLEQKLSANGDYAAAAKVMSARRKVEAQMNGSDDSSGQTAGVAVLTDSRYVFPVAEAALSGSVTWDEGSASLRSWGETPSTARWLLPADLPAGGYEVEISFSCAGEAVGGKVATVVVKEGFHRMQRDVTARSGSSSTQTVNLGTLRVEVHSRKLQIVCTAVPAAAFQILSLHLLPVESLP